MRIRTNRKYAWWMDRYDDVAEQLDEQTRSGAVDISCAFTRNMLANIHHITYQLPRISTLPANSE